jgi:hypothetical protein
MERVSEARGVKEERSPGLESLRAGPEWVRWGQWKEEQREEAWRNRHAWSRESTVWMEWVHGNVGACHRRHTPVGQGDQMQGGNRSMCILVGICTGSRQDSRMRCGTIESHTWTGRGSRTRRIISGIHAGPGWGSDMRCVTPRIHGGDRRGR